ncbi:MAG: SDR family NAD(P)-dependent oxidoreductase, partial [Deltaproteobacteria bacterium]|nr:SDR family NAD(P)-dependent oxidoreductase [Deltaproteobacteria bacterium]
RDARAVDEAARLAVTALGAPDLAVNCAGVQRARAFDELPAEDFDLVVDVNLKGSRNFAAALLPRLAPGGSLVLVASLAGLVGNYGYAAYNASKFGVVGLGAALRIEYRPRGLRVTVVCPPEVETPMVAEERLSAPEVTFATKKLAGTVELDELISALLRGAARGDALVVPGLRARATSLLARLAPGMVSRTTDLVVARALRGSGK